MFFQNSSVRLLVLFLVSLLVFPIPCRADLPAPTVTTTIPASGTTYVAINAPIISIFSEAMNGATINSSSFKLDRVSPGTLTFNLVEPGTTTTYTGSYTTEPFAGVYGGWYSGDGSGSFYTGISGGKAIRGFSYDSEDVDYFTTTLIGSSSPWSFSSTSAYGTYFSGNVSADSTWGTWNNSGYTGTFSGSKLLGNDGSAGYNKDVYTYSDNFGIAAAEVYGSEINGMLVDVSEPDVFYGSGTVYDDYTFSIPNIYSGHYGNVVASAYGTINMAATTVSGTVSYDPSTYSATFTPSASLTPNSTYRATVTTAVTDATGTPMSVNKVWSFTTGNLTAKLLSLTMGGSGSGRVISTPSGIDCDYPPQTGFCSAYFVDTFVSLVATADTGSVFSGWGGDCSDCPFTSCFVTMDASKSCTVAFSPLMVMIEGYPGGYETIQEAFDGAGNGNLLKGRGATTSENILLDKNVSITLKGGYNSDFSLQTGVTTIDGSLTVESGELTVQEVEIQ